MGGEGVLSRDYSALGDGMTWGFRVQGSSV